MSRTSSTYKRTIEREGIIKGGMPIHREITRPALGIDQEPSTIQWKSSLRSPSPSPRGPSRSQSLTRSRSRSRNRSLTGSLVHTRSPSPTLRRSKSPLHSSSRLVKSLANSSELRSIENDYVRNLQQQIYFLELEANHLRDQNRKATEMHPHLVAETERLSAKLRELQLECDDLNVECRRKDATLDVVHSEKDRVLTKLEEENIHRQREKRVLTEEIITLKKQRDALTLENERRASQIDHVSVDKDRIVMQLRESQATIDSLNSQLDLKVEQLNETLVVLDEKKSQCIQAEAHARDVEDKFYTTTSILHEKQLKDLRDEIRMLRNKLKEADLRSDEDRRMIVKMQDESSHLVAENAMLCQRNDDLNKQLDREKELRENTDLRRSQNMIEITRLNETEKELKFDLRTTDDALKTEKARADRYFAQLKKQEDTNTTLQLNNTTTRSKLAEIEGTLMTLDDENAKLRRDKQLLVDHVAELQQQLTRKDDELAIVRRQRKVLAKDLQAVESEKVVDETIQSQKWQEFESLADSMKSLSRSMSHSTSPLRSPRSSRIFT